MKRKIALLMAGMLAIGMLAGCRGNKDSADEGGTDAVSRIVPEFKTYVAEDIDFGNINKNASIYQIKYLDGYLYYNYTTYAEYPDEFYEEVQKLDEEMYGNTSAGDNVRDIDNEPAADVSDNAPDKTKDKSGDKEDVDDDDLLGDMDDIFGDGSTPEEPSDNGGGSEDSSDAASDGGTMSQEEYEKRYNEILAKYPDCKNYSCIEKFNIETSERTEIIPLDADSYEESVNNFVVFSDGSLALLFERYGQEDSESGGSYTLKYFDAEGKEKGSKNVNEMFNINPDTYINSIAVDNNDNLLMNTGEKDIAVISVDGTYKGSITFEDYMSEFTILPDNTLVASCYGEDGEYVAKADIETLKANGKLLEGKDGANMAYGVMNGNKVYDFISRDSQSLYAYDSSKDTMVELLKWMDCELIGDNVDSVIPLADGRFICSGYDNSGNRILCYLKENADGEGSSKNMIKVMAPYADSSVQQKIIEYNKANPDCKVELISFDNDEDSYTSMANAMITGDAPDIINLSNIDITNYVSKGLLVDLLPYMQKDDVYNEDYYVDGLLDATAMDGKQYLLMDSFSITTFVGRKSELGKFKNGWTLNDMMDYYNSKPEGSALISGNSREEILYTFVLHDINQYINWNTGEVKFDSEEFKKAIEFCKGFPSGDDIDYDDEDTTYKDIKSGKLLLQPAFISSTEEIQLNRGLFDKDEFYVGYPCAEGLGTYIMPNEAYGICSSSDNKDKAWDVIKYLLKPEMRTDENGNETSIEAEIYGIPASSASFEKRLEKEMATKKYTDENGEEIYPRDTSYTYGSMEIKIGPATEEEVQTLRDIIKNSKGLYYYDSDIVSMLQEDINKYLNGDKNLDDVVKIIQDKMSKYVNENK